MIETLRRAVAGCSPFESGPFRECRQCGTTVEDDEDCPSCGSSDIAKYEL
ncbi:hypothetical protein [Halomicrobium salinisoli]|nr:hypothetical protein [Halomicrobium salinisoli]